MEDCSRAVDLYRLTGGALILWVYTSMIEEDALLVSFPQRSGNGTSDIGDILKPYSKKSQEKIANTWVHMIILHCTGMAW